MVDVTSWLQAVIVALPFVALWRLERVIEIITELKNKSEIRPANCHKQLETKEEVLKSINEKQTQLQTDIDGLTETVQSLNETVQRLCETQKNLCRDLLTAAKSGDVNTAKVLFKYSNDSCTDDDEYRNTPLTYAAWKGHVEVVRVLLEGGANIERADACRRTALHGAAWYGKLEVCSLLLNWGANVDHLNKWQNNPLHVAAWNGHLSVVELLVERGGADVSVKGMGGQTASVMARSKGHQKVAEWLDSVGVAKDS